MPTECAYCKDKQFKTPEEYAKHILKKHPTDDIRVGWAKELLRVEEEMSTEDSPEEEEPKDEIDAVLATLLRPEVMDRIRGCRTPAEKSEEEKPKKRKPKKPEPEVPAKAKRSFHWPLVVVMGIIILVLLFAVCRLAY